MANTPQTASGLSDLGVSALSRKAYKGGNMACKTPGKKIRSKGMGRGMAVGNGRGPIGVPVGMKAAQPIQKIDKRRKK